MRRFLSLVLAVSFAVPALNAATTTQRGRMVRKEPPAQAEPQPEKLTFFQRLFGIRPKRRAVPPPQEPAPTPKRKPVTRSKPRSSTPPDSTASTATSPSSTGETPTKPAPPKNTKTSRTKTTQASSTGANVDTTGMDTAAKFRAVRAQALEDPEVKTLKTKADTTVDAAEADKALGAYNRALFGKIREIDPSLKSYADKVEQSLNKRIGSEKP